METISFCMETFHTFTDYLYSTGQITDIHAYRRDIVACLEHVRRFKAYEFASSFCSDKKSLDLGCGAGYGAQYVARRSAKTTAIDTHLPTLQFATRNHVEQNLSSIAASANLLPLKDSIFDVVLSFRVIEHIDPRRIPSYLSEVVRVLRPEGVALVTTPNRKYRLHPFQKPFNEDHYTEYTPKRFHAVLRDSFREVEILGLCAPSWIEQICCKKLSLMKYYIQNPVDRAVRFIVPSRLPEPFVKRVKAAKGKSRALRSTSQDGTADDRLPAQMEPLTMEDLSFERDSLGSSMCLLAICASPYKGNGD